MEGAPWTEPRLLRYPRHADARGWVAEGWRCDWGLPASMQDNLCWSRRGALRGLHFQLDPPQGKLVTVLQGTVWDVVVDLRTGHWQSFALEAQAGALWIPPGYAHGFYVCSDEALVWYKLSAPRHPPSERTLAWNDPLLAIPWPLRGEPLLSERDRQGLSWRETREILSSPG